MLRRTPLGSVQNSLVLALLILLSLAACGLGSAQEQQPGTTGNNLTIAPGDLIDIEVFNTPELSGKFRVGQSGMVSLPQGGVIDLNGLSTVQAGTAIEARLRSAQIMLDPHVTVLVQEYASQGVIVAGEVKNPGTYTLLGEHSLYGALSAAGGPTTNEGDSIVLTRHGDPSHKQVIPVTSPNFEDLIRATRVEPGDTVFVSRANVFYVVGNVGHSGAFPIRNGEQIRVLEAIAIAEGTQKNTAEGKVSIIRATPEGTQSLPLDLKKIYANKAVDPVLQAKDILVIPRSAVKAFFDTAVPYVAADIASALVTAAIVK